MGDWVNVRDLIGKKVYLAEVHPFAMCTVYCITIFKVRAYRKRDVIVIEVRGRWWWNKWYNIRDVYHDVFEARSSACGQRNAGFSC